jgi:LPXTG-site transpeptidase (sortase) family protein
MVLKQKCWIGIRYLFLVITIAILVKPLYHTGVEMYYRHQSKKIWEGWQTMGDSLGFIPAGWLSIPAVNINTLVIEDATEKNLEKFPGLDIIGANLKVISAHRDVHFFPLKDISMGQQVHFEWKNKKVIKYEVMEIEILKTEYIRKRLLEKSNEDWLVLLTCYPFSYIGPAPQRFVVWCKKIS